ncbi:ATP-binding cassette domain-containing protein [Streptacidiphilus sp. EB129]|jgi:ABC-2 type transport system ATP-binding protein|uniref:ABC transporter ATP-binding protein n=1 Tax=Streptacidiphilus sp. EB129 TaxID=3156262 RepID=UPI0035155C08
MGDATDAVRRTDGAAVTAEALGLRGPRGWVYRGVDLDLEPDTLTVVTGPAGSGRTSLLLTLAGRMRPTEGRAGVAGLRLPRQAAAVRRLAALGPVPGVNDLEGALTVAEHLRERRLLHFPRRAPRRSTEQALGLVGLAVESLPGGLRTQVRELDPVQSLRLSTALALLGRPRLLLVDDADERLSATERAAAWAMLRAVADSGTTVVAGAADAPESADTTVRLESADAHA